MDECIGFWEVRRHTSLCCRVADHSKFLCPTFLTVEDGDDTDELPVLDPGSFEIRRIDLDHPSTAGDSSVPIVESIEGGVVLIVGAHRLQNQVARGRNQVFESTGGKLRPTFVCRKRTLVPWRIGGRTKPYLSRTRVLKSSAPEMTREAWSRMTL